MHWNPSAQTSSPTAAFPTGNAAISSYQRQKNPTTFSLTLLLSTYLYHFLSPVPLFQSDWKNSHFIISPIVLSFSSVLAAAIQGLQGSEGLKVSLEQSPPKAEHCAWLSSTVISAVPPPPTTLGTFSSRPHVPLAWHIESQKSLKYFEFIITVAATETFDFSV